MRLFLLALIALVHRPSRTEPATQAAAVEDAWKIHAALVDWTGKVDQKASFALAVESAVVAAIITLSNNDRILAHLTDEGLWLYRVGACILVVAIAFAMAAVKPQLRAKKLGDEWRNNWVFFGHLRRWEAHDLTKALKQKDILPVLSQQLIKMSDIAWKKHRHLQRSLSLSALATILVVMAGMQSKGFFGRIANSLMQLIGM